MEITFEDHDPRIAEAVKIANTLLQNETFYQEISDKTEFELSTASPRQISSLLKNSELEFKVQLFYPKGLFNRFKYRKTFAYTDHGCPNILFLNKRKLNREVERIGATIIHECIHALDHDCTDYTFGHGNNSSKGKSNTAPYWIGNKAYKMLSNNLDSEELTFNQLDRK